MVRLGPLIGAATVATAIAGGASAAPFCFVPGTAMPTSDGYRTAMILAERSRAEDSWRMSVEIDVVGGRTSEGLEAERARAIQLELRRSGIGFGQMRIVDRPATSSDCLTVDVVQTDPPYRGLWHYWGPYFDFRSATLSEQMARGLEWVVVGYVPGRDCFRLDGHADTAGPAEANFRLSRRRAEAVARRLIWYGVRETDIEIHAHGETRLARASEDGVSEPLNRRVTVDVRGRRCTVGYH